MIDPSPKKTDNNTKDNLREIIATISFKLTNTGPRAGTEIPQLYIGYPNGSGEPPKVLRGFEDVELVQGESCVVSFSLEERDLRFVVPWLCS